MTEIFQEDKLVIGLQNKDPESFAMLYDLYAPKVYRFLFFRTMNESVAQDITSIVFLKIWGYILNKNNKPIKNPKAFVYTTSRNELVNFYRERAHKEFETNIDTVLLEQLALINNSPEEIFDKSSFNIQSYLKKLKDEYREILILRYIEEMSIAEIAQILNKGRITVRVTLHRALNSLRKIIHNKT